MDAMSVSGLKFVTDFVIYPLVFYPGNNDIYYFDAEHRPIHQHRYLDGLPRFDNQKVLIWNEFKLLP